jgi:hypothetical protein
MIANTHPETGIRYGVIACNSLDPDVYNDLWQNGKDLSYEEAAKDLQAEVDNEADDIEEEAAISRGEIDGGPPTEADIERAFEAKGYPDRESFIDGEFEKRAQDIQIDEPVIEGEHEGVKYRISWLGGAPLLWVFEGPIGYAERLCSPCVPNAADLDGGFEPDTGDEHGTGYLCYIVPRDWLSEVER